MSDPRQILTICSVAAFFAGVVGSRVLGERALRSLDDAQRLRLLDGFSRARSLQLVPVAILVLVVLALGQFVPASRAASVALLWLGLAAWTTGSLIWSWVRLRRLALPAVYLRGWLGGRVVMIGGLAAMLVGLYLAGFR